MSCQPIWKCEKCGETIISEKEYESPYQLKMDSSICIDFNFHVCKNDNTSKITGKLKLIGFYEIK